MYSTKTFKNVFKSFHDYNERKYLAESIHPCTCLAETLSSTCNVIIIINIIS